MLRLHGVVAAELAHGLIGHAVHVGFPALAPLVVLHLLGGDLLPARSDHAPAREHSRWVGGVDRIIEHVGVEVQRRRLAQGVPLEETPKVGIVIPSTVVVISAPHVEILPGEENRVEHG